MVAAFVRPQVAALSLAVLALAPLSLLAAESSERPPPPEAAFVRAADDSIRVELTSPVSASGYNVYRGRDYLTTVRPARGSTRFSFLAPLGGDYCLVAFVESDAGTRYGRCSTPGTVPAAFEDEPDPADDGPGVPPNFRSAVYSEGVAEIFWDIARSPSGRSAFRYRIVRDGVELDVIGGRSRFETRLDPERTYVYEVSAIDRDGGESAPAMLSLRPSELPPPDTGDDTPLSIAFTSEAVTLVEGAAVPARARLEVTRPRGEDDPIALEILPDDEVERHGLLVALATDRLEPGVDGTSLTLSLPVGLAPRLPHQHRLHVRASVGGRTAEAMLTVRIEPTAAPDVYLLIGQSNMEGYSERGAKRAGPGEPDEPIARVRQLHVPANNEAAFPDSASYTDEAANVVTPLFIAAEDPLHNRSWNGRPKSGTSIGPALTFGKTVLERTTADVYLVPAAWGATGFCANSNDYRAWNATPYPAPGLGGTRLLDRALTRLEVTLRESGGVLRGILWHQGGADSNDARCAESYAENLKMMIERLRSEAPLDPRGPSARGPRAPIPFVAATMSFGADERFDFSAPGRLRLLVDAAHRSVATLVPYADFINNDDLIPPAYPCGRSSCVHFGAEAMREQGRRFDAALVRIIEGAETP